MPQTVHVYPNNDPIEHDTDGTEKYDDAEAALRWIAGGRIVSRAVAYYPWKAALL